MDQMNTAPGHAIYESTTERKFWCECGHVFAEIDLKKLDAEYHAHL